MKTHVDPDKLLSSEAARLPDDLVLLGFQTEIYITKEGTEFETRCALSMLYRLNTKGYHIVTSCPLST